MRMRFPLRVLGVWLVALALARCGKTHRTPPAELVVAACRPLAGPLRAALAHAPHPAKLVIVASDQIAHQVSAKPPPDLVVARESPGLSQLQKSGKLVAKSLQPLVQDHLVIIGFPASPIPLQHPEQLARLGAPRPPWRGRVWVLPPSTPAGVLTRSYLQSLRYKGRSVWDATADRRGIAPDVATAQKQVETTKRGLAIVLSRDAAKMGDKVKLMLDLTGKDAPRIRYDVGLVSAGQVKRGQQLLDFLQAPAQLALFSKQGWQRARPGK